MRVVDSAPKIWVLNSFRAGENAQITSLANFLGEPWQSVRVDYNRVANMLALARCTSLTGIAKCSSELAPPWPELVITASLRNEPICRWIKRESGGRSKVVFLGRTWSAPGAFDLVISTPQYHPAPAANVLCNPLTIPALHADIPGEPDRLPSGLRQPVYGVLIGGNSGPFVFNRAVVNELLKRLSEIRQATGCTFVISTSARTSGLVVDELSSFLAEGDYLYRWRANDKLNPFTEILCKVQKIIVTGDSVAMLSDAIASGKPTYIFELPTSGFAGIGAAVYRLAMRWVHRRLTRDVGIVHRRVYSEGWARSADLFTDDWQPGTPDYIAPTVARLQLLLAEDRK
jgi:mitochondrial fission protein ELM1